MLSITILTNKALYAGNLNINKTAAIGRFNKRKKPIVN